MYPGEYRSRELKTEKNKSSLEWLEVHVKFDCSKLLYEISFKYII